MRSIIERLEAKIEELSNLLDLNSGGSYGSQRKEFLNQQIKNCEGLIEAYRHTSVPLTLQEAEEKLNQQVGFEEQKELVLEEINIRPLVENRSIEQKFPIFCFVGPSGVGKTTFAKILAQALGKPFFLLALGGETKSSTLIGGTTESPRAEIGKIAKCLIQGEKSDPFILLDEIDKTSLHDTLNHLLDPEQNQNIYDHCLGMELDFSKITFVATANDPNKIPEYLYRRVVIVELKKYTKEQKKEIARNVLQKWIENNNLYHADQPLLTITDEALDTLISKTHEKGVRQLKSALENNIFRYCLQKWAAEDPQGQSISKIVIIPDLVNQIIPQSFPNVDQEDNQDKNNKDTNKEQLEILRKELKTLQWEKDKLANIVANNNRSKLKASKFRALNMIQKALNNARLAKGEIIFDNRNYKKEVNDATSPEAVEAIREEFLLWVAEKFKEWESTEKIKAVKNYSNNWVPTQQNEHKILEKLVKEISKMNDNNVKINSMKNLEEQLIQIQERNNDLAKQLDNSQQNYTQIKEDLRKEIQNLKETRKISWSTKNPWFILFIVISLVIIVGGTISGILIRKKKR